MSVMTEVDHRIPKDVADQLVAPAAYADGRGRHSMRLNFSSSADEDIREGVRRIGKIVAEQLALYDSLTGRRRPPPAAPPRAAEPEIEPAAPDVADAAASDAGMAHILQLPRRGSLGGRRSREA